MKRQLLVGFLLCGLGLQALAQSVLYTNDFEKAEVGKLPDGFQILDGGFAVNEEGGNKVLELPGAPLESFSVQFGPAASENIAISARVKGTARGRRAPTFGVGLNGVAGFRLQLAPAKNRLELYRDQELKAQAPYEWKSGEWIRFRLQVRKVKDGEWKIEGRAWPATGTEPKEWMVAGEEKEAPPPGRASVLGSPFSGTPIQFDDLVVAQTPTAD